MQNIQELTISLGKRTFTHISEQQSIQEVLSQHVIVYYRECNVVGMFTPVIFSRGISW